MRTNKSFFKLVLPIAFLSGVTLVHADIKSTALNAEQRETLAQINDTAKLLPVIEQSLRENKLPSNYDLAYALAYADALLAIGEVDAAKSFYKGVISTSRENKGEESFEYLYARSRSLQLKFHLGIKEYLEQSNRLAGNIKDFVKDINDENTFRQGFTLVKSIYTRGRVTNGNKLRVIGEALNEKSAMYLDASDLDKLESEYYSALLLFRAQKFEDSITLLENLITRIEKNEDAKGIEVKARRALVTFLEKRRKPEVATPHVIAIAQILSENGTTDERVLRKVNPKYPIRAARERQEGSATVIFDIDKTGRLDNIRVSSVDGNEEFGDAALSAVQKWRYAPRLVDGEAVKVKDKTVILEFKLNKA